MKYFDEPLIFLMNNNVFEGIKTQTKNTKIYDVHQCRLRPRRCVVSCLYYNNKIQ